MFLTRFSRCSAGVGAVRRMPVPSKFRGSPAWWARRCVTVIAPNFPRNPARSSGNSSASVVSHVSAPCSTRVASSVAVMALVSDPRGHLSSVVARASVPRFRTPTTADVTEPSPRMNAAPSAGTLRAFRMESSRWAIALSPDCASVPVAATHSTRTARMPARFICQPFYSSVNPGAAPRSVEHAAPGAPARRTPARPPPP